MLNPLTTYPLSLLATISLLSFDAHSITYRYLDPEGRLLLTDKRMGSEYTLLEKTDKGWVIQQPKYSWAKNKRRFSSAIDHVATEYQIPKYLLHAIITVESAYNPNAKSHAGALGLMQLMPATANRFGVRDPFNPKENIKGGTRYLKYLLALFDNNLTLTLAAYNAGENAVKRYNNTIPPYRETQHYVKKVLKYYRKYKAAS